MANPPLKTKANYHRLASVMTGGKDLAILRRFDELSILSLLSLQAEILHLESQYNRQCERDGVSNDASEAEYSTYFRALHKSREANGEQIRLLDEIQLKVSAYSWSTMFPFRLLSKINNVGLLTEQTFTRQSATPRYNKLMYVFAHLGSTADPTRNSPPTLKGRSSRKVRARDVEGLAQRC